MDLDELRERVTAKQRATLDRIWAHVRDTGECIPARILFHGVSKSEALAALEDLGGSVVFSRQEGGVTCYDVTLLGALLSSHGRSFEDLLIGYLAHLKSVVCSDPAVNEITRQEVDEKLGLDPLRSASLFRLIEKSHLHHGWRLGPEMMWSVRIPEEADDLEAHTDLRDFIRQRALRSFDPKTPIDATQAWLYSEERRRSPLTRGEFWFIREPLLRRQLEQDWAEAELTRDVQAWKGCTVLCGGVLEGLLIDAILRRQERCTGESQPNSLESLSKLYLPALVKKAREVSLLGESDVHLSEVLRSFRNLIHPGLQLREGLQVSEHEALVAFNAVKILIRKLAPGDHDPKR